MYVSCVFKNILNITTQLCTVKIKYIFVQKREADTFFSFYKIKANTKIIFNKKGAL